MSYLYYDFPNTCNYNSDLGFLIKEYKRLNGSYDQLVKIYEYIKENIKEITLEQLQEWLDSGLLVIDIKYTKETENISFVFKKRSN